MPDWSYRTLFRPLLFALPARTAHDVAAGVLGALARVPLGPQLIDFLGHMRPPTELQVNLLGRTLAAPIGLGAELDPQGKAWAALARFGIGFLEIGPVVSHLPRRGDVRRDPRAQPFYIPAGYTEIPCSLALERMSKVPGDVAFLVRISWPAEPNREAVEAFISTAQAFASDRRVAALAIDVHDFAAESLEALAAACASLPRELPLLVTLMASTPAVQAVERVRQVRQFLPSVQGVVLPGSIDDGQGRAFIGLPASTQTIQLVRALRHEYGAENLVIVAGGGVHEPQQAIDLLEAGAQLVKVESGLIFSGPGLTKRINEALLARQEREPAAPRGEAPRYAWYWMWLMGVAMLVGGWLALVIATTRVVLPYDEQFVGMTRDELMEVNPRLLSFMIHDRVTLAGTMLAVGVLYSGLAWFAVRRGEHWAWVAVLVSALAGFFSFFSFLGFGYFEPFHAFVTALLFQLLLMSWHAPLPPNDALHWAPLTEDWRQRWAWWGQLGLVVESLAVLVAGATICIIGSTSVFVAQDLDYIQTCSESLLAANPRLLPLVAHDRATFGGMLMACALATLMTTLWGFSAGQRWLLGMLALSGGIGYLATLIVHVAVGYIDPVHLAPALAGLGLHAASLLMSAPFLWHQPTSPRARKAGAGTPARSHGHSLSQPHASMC